MKMALSRACRFLGLLLVMTLCGCRSGELPLPDASASEAIQPAIQDARDVAFDHPPDGQDAPAVIEIAAIDPHGEDKPASAIPTERLAWRFARAGIRLRPHLLDALFEDGSLALAEEGDGLYQAALTLALAVYPVLLPQLMRNR